MLIKLFVQLYPLAWIYGSYLLINVISGSSATFSVVLSESMEPEIKRGDLIFSITPNNLRVGDIVLYQLPHKDIPIVHRIIELIDEERVLTKGDNNNIDDRGLYYPSFKYLPKSAIIGKVRGHLPWIGYLSIWAKDFKVILISLIAIEIIYNISKESDETEIPNSRMEWLKFFLYPGLK